MMNTTTIQLLFLIWLLPFVLNAQIDHSKEETLPFVAERMLIHTDRDLYITGETVWLKIYTLDANQKISSDFSKVAYLELINDTGIPLSRIKIELENGLGIGTIELPSTLKNGNYIIRAYTQAMRNLGEKAFGEKVLMVINPKQALIQPIAASLSKPLSKVATALPIPNEQYLSLNLQTDKSDYSQRSLVSLEITAKDHLGQPKVAQFSLAVALANNNNTAPPLFKKSTIPSTSELVQLPSNLTFMAETEGLSLSGKVINKNTNEGLENAEVYLAFPGKTALLYTATTDKSGAFSFLLPKLYGLRQVVLQAFSKETTALAISLTEEFQEVITNDTSNFLLPLELISYANALMVNAQINQTYQAFVPQSAYLAENEFAEVPFYSHSDNQYFLDDYTRFPLPEFFYEIVPKIRVKGKFGSERLEVVGDWESSYTNRPPLLLVDGVPVFDQATFLKINNKLIKSAEIITTPFWLNPGVYNGMIQLSSFEGDARSFTLPETALRRSFIAFLPQKQFPPTDYDLTLDSRLPDFRNTLFWNPMIQTNAEGKAKIQFYTSDALGQYDIHLQGITTDNLMGTQTATIQVVKTK